MTFTRPANHRQLTFEEIAKSAKITVNEVRCWTQDGPVIKLPPRGFGAPVSTVPQTPNHRRHSVSFPHS